MNREANLTRVRESRDPFDIVIVGGGATGAGVAVDAASRGFNTLLLEREDFGKGTSSRSTKLVHGGVRYLEQGNISLVMEALRERGILRRNAPHLVHDVPFIVPNYSWWETPFYGIGLKIYDLLAGQYGFGKSRLLSREETLERLPNLRQDGLRGGVIYHDGQFDDARLLIHLLATAVDHGAIALNYAPAVEITRDSDGFVNGVVALDAESGNRFSIPARVVVNATGMFTDETRQLADKRATPMMVPSQGIHLVLDRSFLAGNSAIMVPHTSDGRVLFAIPWHHHTVVGTTDTPIERPSYEPRPFDHEIEFVLETAGEYLARPPRRQDVLSVFVGIRPLVRQTGATSTTTSALSRDHTIHIDDSGLLTIAGGKWTTYRRMAEDTVDHAITLGRLPDQPCVTRELRVHGYAEAFDESDPLWVYGSDAAGIRAIARESPQFAQQLDAQLPSIAAEVIWAARKEMARTVEDVLARRIRALFLDARAAIRMAPAVAALLASELHKNAAWIDAEVARFRQLAAQYLLETSPPCSPA